MTTPVMFVILMYFGYSMESGSDDIRYSPLLLTRNSNGKREYFKLIEDPSKYENLRFNSVLRVYNAYKEILEDLVKQNFEKLLKDGNLSIISSQKIDKEENESEDSIYEDALESLINEDVDRKDTKNHNKFSNDALDSVDSIKPQSSKGLKKRDHKQSKFNNSNKQNKNDLEKRSEDENSLAQKGKSTDTESAQKNEFLKKHAQEPIENKIENPQSPEKKDQQKISNRNISENENLTDDTKTRTDATSLDSEQVKFKNLQKKDLEKGFESKDESVDVGSKVNNKQKNELSAMRSDLNEREGQPSVSEHVHEGKKKDKESKVANQQKSGSDSAKKRVDSSISRIHSHTCEDGHSKCSHKKNESKKILEKNEAKKVDVQENESQKKSKLDSNDGRIQTSMNEDDKSTEKDDKSKEEVQEQNSTHVSGQDIGSDKAKEHSNSDTVDSQKQSAENNQENQTKSQLEDVKKETKINDSGSAGKNTTNSKNTSPMNSIRSQTSIPGDEVQNPSQMNKIKISENKKVDEPKKTSLLNKNATNPKEKPVMDSGRSQTSMPDDEVQNPRQINKIKINDSKKTDKMNVSGYTGENATGPKNKSFMNSGRSQTSMPDDEIMIPNKVSNVKMNEKKKVNEPKKISSSDKSAENPKSSLASNQARTQASMLSDEPSVTQPSKIESEKKNDKSEAKKTDDAQVQKTGENPYNSEDSGTHEEYDFVKAQERSRKGDSEKSKVNQTDSVDGKENSDQVFKNEVSPKEVQSMDDAKSDVGDAESLPKKDVDPEKAKKENQKEKIQAVTPVSNDLNPQNNNSIQSNAQPATVDGQSGISDKQTNNSVNSNSNQSIVSQPFQESSESNVKSQSTNQSKNAKKAQNSAVTKTETKRQRKKRERREEQERREAMKREKEEVKNETEQKTTGIPLIKGTKLDDILTDEWNQDQNLVEKALETVHDVVSSRSKYRKPRKE